ncbi:DJ-1/PfpI family protein [Massilia pseudoviolaceinigra]|uniref:DJ-1/PfpI family protein n=1 Tax=Massilia pseudoviolaceinigra TaxID=3057165 RepID=UPI002796BFAE|nr:DJ-1/PfpI family protein [Massilia sp. CCM 9206]MDQ1923826.1 DJ-1/PfpI family protein [Massilia sp. CCM 9206]
MRLSIVLFDGFTALDVVGGYEVLANIPGMEVEFVSERVGLVASDTGRLGMAAYRTFEQLDTTDILYVPGGPGVAGVAGALGNAALMACVRRLHATTAWTVSICNGAEILGAAGLLKGKKVTANWFAREHVAAYGALVGTERYQRDGKLITGAGVSASIDAGLFLASLLGGETLARTIQLGIEYYPAPPFGSGTPDAQPQAAKDLIRHVEQHGAQRLAARVIPF